MRKAAGPLAATHLITCWIGTGRSLACRGRSSSRCRSPQLALAPLAAWPARPGQSETTLWCHAWSATPEHSLEELVPFAQLAPLADLTPTQILQRHAISVEQALQLQVATSAPALRARLGPRLALSRQSAMCARLGHSRRLGRASVCRVGAPGTLAPQIWMKLQRLPARTAQMVHTVPSHQAMRPMDLLSAATVPRALRIPTPMLALCAPLAPQVTMPARDLRRAHLANPGPTLPMLRYRASHAPPGISPRLLLLPRAICARTRTGFPQECMHPQGRLRV